MALKDFETLTRVALGLALLCAGGCAKVALNVGATDYSVDLPAQDPAAAQAAGYQVLSPKYDALTDEDSSLIKKGDTVSVHLQHAFIKDFSERLERVTSKIQGTSVRGEIAVLAKVYELEDGKVLSNTTQSIKDQARLVYYSEDVRSGGHPLNFSSLPVYGPITYRGNPLVIQLVVLELDIAESEQLKGILSTLVGFGSKAYPPASPILQVLDALGSQLLSGEQDDVEFRYDFTLYPTGGHVSLPYAHLRAGNYTLLREAPISAGEQRFAQTDWDAIVLNDKTGRLFKTGSPSEPFLKNTYVTLQINKGFDAVALDTAQAFAEFQRQLNQAPDYSRLRGDLDRAVDTLKARMVDSNRGDQIESRLAEAMSLIESYRVAEAGRDTFKAQVSLAELHDIVVKRIGLPKKAGVRAQFSEMDYAKIVTALRLAALDPLKIDSASVQSTADAAALNSLLH